MRTMYLALVALVTLAACADTNGGNNPAGFDGGSGWKDDDISAEELNDPTSRAYFENSVGNSVLFDVDGFTLNTSAKAALDIQAEWLLSNPGYVVVLEGHADERGTREYNMALGERRANAVKEFLVLQGVSGGLIEVISYGEERAASYGSNDSAWGLNRCVELK